MPVNAGLIEEARLRGTAVTLAAAVRSAGVTTAITYEVRVGTSICDNADRTSSNPSASVRSGAKAAAIRQTLDGIWVNTIVLMRPIRPAICAATGWEKALNTPAQKKNTLAAESDSANFSNSHSASRDWTMKPPAKASRLNNAANLYTTWREGPS